MSLDLFADGGMHKSLESSGCIFSLSRTENKWWGKRRKLGKVCTEPRIPPGSHLSLKPWVKHVLLSFPSFFKGSGNLVCVPVHQDKVIDI